MSDDASTDCRDWSPEKYSLALKLKFCMCRGERPREAQYDARGIFLCYTCDICHEEQMAKYRTDVLTDSNYWCDEPIDGDD